MATIKPDGEYWQPELETMPREQLQQLQVKKLKDTINVCLKSPFYKKRLGDAGITADSINSLDDLRKIPFTTKQDLRDNYPTDSLAAISTMPYVSTLPVVQPVIHAWLFTPSTTSVRGLT